jgi:hypothetical protein
VQDHHRLIIFLLATLAELASFAENVLDERARPEISTAGSANGFSCAFESEHFAAGITGFDDPVGAQNNPIAAPQNSLEDFVGRVFSYAQREGV